MKLLTRFELAAKNKTELHALLRQSFNELSKSNPNTQHRSNALASIENIQQEIGARVWRL